MHTRSQNLRIAFFVDGTSRTSGVDTSTRLLAAALRDQGHQVTVFVPRIAGQTAGIAADSCRLPAFRVHTRPDVYWIVPFSARLLARSFRERFDVIHVHNTTTAYLLAWQLAKLGGTPLIYTYHTMLGEYTHYLGAAARLGPRLAPLVRVLDRRVGNAADLVTTPSPKAKAYLDTLGLATPVTVIPNGIDLAQFAPRPAGDLPARLGLGPERRILLFVGRLNHEKRPLAAYAAFRDLSRRWPQADLVLAGEGPLSVEIAQRSRADGLAGRVHLLGVVPHAAMAALYNAAYLWLSTSTSEVHPMVAVEAVACGLPAVAIADRALEGVVVPNVTGLVVCTEAELVDGLDQLLADPARRERMAAAARQQARQYDIATVSQRFAALYGQLAATGKLPVPAAVT
jgi:1,2-diacylglycerol 3-alpha-glucosyltransferase